MNTWVKNLALLAFLPVLQIQAQTTLTAMDVEQPEGWADELALTIPEDLNPDPNILEIELEAQIANIEVLDGIITPVWTYGGTLPGPLIKAKVGDTVIVHFKNSLPESTTIHWHGLRVPNQMDGVPGVTQPPVPVDGEFRYEFVVDDAGSYGYRPHVNSAAQVGWGMYGPIVVEDPNDPEEFGDDLIMVISDMSLDEAGVFLPPNNGGDFGDLFGREGTTILVNGKVMPTLKVRKGKQQRWRIINASRTRYVPIGLRGHIMTRIGGDNGLAGRSESAPRFILTPAERGDFVFTPINDPGTALMRLGSVNRGFGTERRPEDLMYVETVDLPAVEPMAIPENLRTIEPIDLSGEVIEKELEMTIGMGDGIRNVIMGFNGIPYWNMEPLVARVGETHVWTLINNSGFNHPFHLHGYFFQVLDENRVPEWKDTVDVPDGGTVKIAVYFEGRPGMWMYHCHILDHARVGMMGQLWVGPEGFTGPVPDLSIPMGMD